MTRYPVSLQINGERYDVDVAPDTSLLDVLRDEFGLTGTKANCLEAECGVCTVLLDGKAVNACITLALQCQGRQILTIEGLAHGGELHPLQTAFIECGAVQCGYCIPGMILTAKSLLDTQPDPDEAAIREGLAGTLCRCTGYQKIVDAVAHAARQMNQQQSQIKTTTTGDRQ
ncbi:(2Fe-2S)-binding protein [Ferrovibrio sp.]|uniref:(2Fe-2S)-binding protein n=1 Tax=Ferrovibrio sp. TaxID=1917215 RepID=UPI0025C48BC3|nr:2Fe-2S iron-sulfur cluster-binding protein [Ferrovibrio sp.]